jgi:hypothetical protein
MVGSLRIRNGLADHPRRENFAQIAAQILDGRADRLQLSLDAYTMPGLLQSAPSFAVLIHSFT